jgi:hypothetical protein
MKKGHAVRGKRFGQINMSGYSIFDENDKHLKKNLNFWQYKKHRLNMLIGKIKFNIENKFFIKEFIRKLYFKTYTIYENSKIKLFWAFYDFWWPLYIENKPPHNIYIAIIPCLILKIKK